MIIKKHFLVEFTFDTDASEDGLREASSPMFDARVRNEILEALNPDDTFIECSYSLAVQQMVNIP